MNWAGVRLLVEAPVEAEFEGAGLDRVVGGQVVAFAEEVLGYVVHFEEKAEGTDVGRNVYIQNRCVGYFIEMYRAEVST